MLQQEERTLTATPHNSKIVIYLLQSLSRKGSIKLQFTRKNQFENRLSSKYNGTTMNKVKWNKQKSKSSKHWLSPQNRKKKKSYNFENRKPHNPKAKSNTREVVHTHESNFTRHAAHLLKTKNKCILLFKNLKFTTKERKKQKIKA